ncbi:MAG: hypothetical protein IJP21_00085 [Clostridia bacterium]|nr:hypothetical protein [Clostridia bacterium]
MKKLVVLVLALILVISFCSCKPQSNIPVINTSEQSISSDITQSENTDSKPVNPDINNTSSTGEEQSSNPSSDTNSSLPTTPSDSSGTASENPDKTKPQTDFKICYNQLTDKQKTIYDTLQKAVKDMEIGWISLETPVYTNYRRDINVIVTALQTDMPQYFWLPPAYYTGNSQDGETIRILFEGQDDLTYLIDKSDHRQMEDALFNRVEEIMAQVTATTPFEIELQIHDILCSSVTYANSVENPLVYTAYGALVNGEAVCEGYSRAMQLLLAQYNIISTLVTGDSEGVGHMWNLVNIENAWYHLDTTWNDGKGTHSYFNLTDTEIAKDHGIYKIHTELSYDEIVCETPKPYNFNLPVCDKTDNNYFVKKDYIYSPDGEEKIAKHLMKPFDVIEFKFSDDTFKEQFKANADYYLNLINQILIREKSPFTITNYSITETTLIIYGK